MLILGQPPSACWKASVQEAVGIALVDLLPTAQVKVADTEVSPIR